MSSPQNEEATRSAPSSKKNLIQDLVAGPRLRSKKSSRNKLTPKRLMELDSLGLSVPHQHSSNGLAGINFHWASDLTFTQLVQHIEAKAEELASQGAFDTYANKHKALSATAISKDFEAVLRHRDEYRWLLTCIGNLVLPPNIYFHIDNPAKTILRLLPLVGEYCLAVLKENEKSCHTRTTLQPM
jgi:hypothetical protein